MLKIDGIHTYYGHIHALKGISLEVREGEIVTLIGSNGAGKTTTVNTITGLLRCSRGSISYRGEDITRAPSSEIVKRGMCLSPEGREVFPQLSVEENLQLGAFTVTDKKAVNESFETVYGLFPRLFERKKQTASTLSGGEQQMLSIGRAIMSQPKLLLLDEPSLGLSPNLVVMIFDLIKSIAAQGITVLLIEQNAKMALKIADRGYVLETGRIILSGPAGDLLDNADVKKAYLGNI
jgi:branched-chain amino acid transport system ATP-binding protein